MWNIFKKIFCGKSACSKKADLSNLNDLEDFVDYVVKSLVDFPDEVEIKTIATKEGATIQVRCRKEDIGKIVGKHGKIIMAIRSLVSSAAGRRRQRVSVDVLD